MQTMFDRLQRWSWLRGLLMILIGAWILIAPRQVYRSFLWIVAAVLIIAAIPKLIDGFSARKASGTYGTSLFTGATDESRAIAAGHCLDDLWRQ